MFTQGFKRMEEEHELYWSDIPEELEGDIESDLDGEPGDLHTATDDVASKLEEVKKRLIEMEEEAAALRDMQAKVEREMSAVHESVGNDDLPTSREESDAPSVFDDSHTWGFLEIEAVQNAILLNESELHNRPLKWEVAGTCRQVTAKRTNVPGMKAYRGGRYALYYGYRPRRPYLPPYGKVPRFRRPMRYRPY